MAEPVAFGFGGVHVRLDGVLVEMLLDLYKVTGRQERLETLEKLLILREEQNAALMRKIKPTSESKPSRGRKR